MKVSSQYKKENNLHVATIEILVDIMGFGCEYWLSDVKESILSEYPTIRETLRIACKGTDFIAEKEWITEDEIMTDFTHVFRSKHEDEYYLEAQKTSKCFKSTIEVESKL